MTYEMIRNQLFYAWRSAKKQPAGGKEAYAIGMLARGRGVEALDMKLGEFLDAIEETAAML